jgi:hypothetical protein
MGGGRDEENVKEWKVLKQPIRIWIYIMHCAVSCWMLGERGNREWVRNRGEGLIWLRHNMFRPEVPR